MKHYIAIVNIDGEDNEILFDESELIPAKQYFKITVHGEVLDVHYVETRDFVKVIDIIYRYAQKTTVEYVYLTEAQFNERNEQ